MNIKQAYAFIVFIIHDGYVEYRTDTNAHGSSPTTHHNKTSQEVINHFLESFRNYYAMVEFEIL